MNAAWETLRLVPVAAALIAAPGILYYQNPEHSCVVNVFDRRLILKLAAGGALVAVTLLDVGISALDNREISFPMGMTLLGTTTLLWILYVEHKHSSHPYTLVSIGLSFEVFLSALHWLSTIANSDSVFSTTISFAHLTIKSYVLFLHEQSNWNNLRPIVSFMMDRDQTYGFWNKCFSLSLFDQLIWNPQDGSVSININPKHPELLETLCYRKFNTAWDEHKKSDIRILIACACSLKQEIVLAGLSVVFKTAFKLAIPLWIEIVTSHAQQRASSTKFIATEYTNNSLLLGTFVLLIGWLISDSYSRYAVSSVKLGVRSILGEVILEKLQKRSGATIAQHAKLSLIADDLPEIAEAASLLFQTFANVLEAFAVMCFACYGNNFIILALAAHVTVLLMPLKPIGMAAGEAASRASEKLGERSDAMATMLMSMQGVTTLGHKAALKSIVQQKRVQEKEAYEESRRLRIWPHIIQVSLNALSDIYMFAFDFNGGDDNTSIPLFFKTLTYGLMFRDATRTFMPSARQFTLAKITLSRVQQFLLLPSYEVDVHYITRKDHRSQAIMQFNNATLSLDPSSDSCLQAVSLDINRGSLTVVTGDEKRSILLQAAAGNCTIKDGTIRSRSPSISYCGKDVWVQSKSIKDNIIGDEDFHAEWYDQVARACGLEQDILNLPGYSHFFVTKGNARLSPSQLQRIALARCVYSRASIIILDDILSYQDAASAAAVQQQIFAIGGLLRHGTTVLMATNNWQSFMNMGARFISVDDGGEVTDTTEGDLVAAAGHEGALNPAAEHLTQLKRDCFAGSATQLMTRELLSKMRTENPIANKVECSTFSQYVGKEGMASFILAVVFIGSVVLLERFLFVLIFRWFQAGTFGSPSIYASIFCSVIIGPIWAAGVWFICMRVAQPTCDRLYERLLKTILEAKYEFFTDDNVERSIRLVCESFKALSHDSYRDILYCIYEPMYCTTLILLATYPNPVGFLIVGLTVTFFYLLHHFHYPIWQCLSRMETRARRSFQAHFIDTATGSIHIRAFGWDLKNSLQNRHHIDRHRQTSSRLDSLERWLFFVYDLVVMSLMTLAMLAALYSNLEPYRIGLALFALMSFGESLKYIMGSWNGLRNNLCIMKEMEDFIETTPREEPSSMEPLPSHYQVCGEIRFTDASLSYQENGVPRLEHINMVIPKGARFGLFGQAQSGKSAVLLALRGLLSYSGSITLDGEEIRDIPRDHLNDIFTTLPERPVVFPGATVLETLFPSEILQPGNAKSHQRTMSMVLYQLGLIDIIEEVGGYQGKFEDLYLTADQMHLFSLARLIGEYLSGKGSVVLIDGVTGRVGLDTHARMRLAIRDFLSQDDKTLLYTFGNDTLVLHSTHISQIVGRTIAPVDLGAAT